MNFNPIMPTLYIGLGGTGADVLLSFRQKILANSWGSQEKKVKLNALSEFPFAQFIYYDLDKAGFYSNGIQTKAVQFTDDEKIVDSFDLNKYSDDENALDIYPQIKSWLPLTSNKIRELGIDTSQGSGQIRALSRLYFFDKYTQIRDTITRQLNKLKIDFADEEKFGATSTNSRVRIVVVASIAGGTGSGAFLDMGWLLNSLVENEGIQADINLMLLMPTAFATANKDKVQANAYAALMELEAAMRGNKANAGRWSYHDKYQFYGKPYSEVYLIDSSNLAQKNTNNIQNIYHMLADSMLDDFASPKFAMHKRAVAVNQGQYKNTLYNYLTVDQKFNKDCFTYSKAYSSMGRAALDTKITIRQELQTCTLASEMLKAYFLNQPEFNSSSSDVNELMDLIDNKKEILQATVNSTLGTSIDIDTPTTLTANIESTQLVAWSTGVLNELGNSQQIIEMLATHQGRSEIVAKVLKLAEGQLLSNANLVNEATAKDPLISALEQMTANTRADLFTKWLTLAMPWVNITDAFVLKSEQYKCFIAVLNPEEFKNKFGDELNACMPAHAGISANQLFITNTDEHDKAICYTEFSGLPLTALNSVEAWRKSYNKNSDMPLHTHLDTTQFSHVVAPSEQELVLLENDFKYFLIAVMTGILTRSTLETIPAGLYEFAVSEGYKMRIGNERSIRKDGITLYYREAIIERVKQVVENSDSYCLAVLSALASYYETRVYTPITRINDVGDEEIITGFASIVAAETAVMLSDMAKRKGLLATEIDLITKALLASSDILKTWTNPIIDSHLDAYSWEVKAPEYENELRLKMVIKEELLAPGKLANFVQTMLTLPPSLTTVITPVLTNVQFYLGINGQPTGPFNIEDIKKQIQAGAVVGTTKVWRQGLEAWVDVSSLLELKVLLNESTLSALPPPLN